MKFIHVSSLLLTCIVFSYMTAASEASQEATYAKTKATVGKAVKEKKIKAKTPKQKVVKAKETKTKKIDKTAKTKKTVKAPKTTKMEKPAKIEKTAKTTKVAKTPKQAKVKKAPAKAKVVKAEEPIVEKVARRTPDIKTLEPRTALLGQEFMISRPASPNFGRTWKLHKPLPMQIEMVGDAKFVPAAIPGKNEGTMVFTFKGVKPGFTQIEFEKIYPPELRDVKPLKVRIVPVEIKETETK